MSTIPEKGLVNITVELGGVWDLNNRGTRCELPATSSPFPLKLRGHGQVESQNLGLLLDDLGDFRPNARRGEFKKQVLRMVMLNRRAYRGAPVAGGVPPGDPSG